MSFSVEDSIFIAADHKIAGPVAYESYPGQILPADLSKIIWYDSTFGGSDTTGDGSYATPYATREKCLELVTLLRFYILDRSMGGRFETDPDERVYWNPATGDDGDDGLTEGTAVETYAAAKAAAVGAGRATIHALGSFTMTDILDFPTQGEVGETLIYSYEPELKITEVLSTSSRSFTQIARTASGALIAIGYNTSNGNCHILRSTDKGFTWTGISNPWSATSISPTWIAVSPSLLLITGVGGSPNVLTSSDDGLTWSTQSVGASLVNKQQATFTGTNFIVVANDSSNVQIRYSPNGTTWSAATFTIPTNSQTWGIASDGAGKVILVGRKTSTTPLVMYSTDHGINWTDISSNVGVGINTGGFICSAVEYRNGKWFIFQDTINPAVYFATDPTTIWASHADDLYYSIGGLAQRGSRVGYSALKGGFVYAQSTSLYPSIKIVNSDAITEYSSDSVLYNCYASLVYENNGAEYWLFCGDNGSSVGKIILIESEASNIRGDASNMTHDEDIEARCSADVSLLSFSSNPVSGAGLSMSNGCKLISCSVKADENGVEYRGSAIQIEGSFIKSGVKALLGTGFAAVQDDISIQRNTIIGDTDFQNAGGTKKELIRDNIFHGDVSAVDPVKILGGDISGGRSNVDAESDVQAINPMIQDEDIGKLQRESDGSPANSYLCSTSNYFTAADGEKADPGAWSGIYTLEAELYQYPFWMPKPLTDGAIRHGKRVTSGDLQGLLGEIDVYNNPDLQQEILTITLKTVPSDLLAHFRVLEGLRDTKVLVNTNPEKWKTQNSFTLSAAASAGDIVLNIDPAVVYHGQWFQWAGRKYYIRIVLDDESAATRVVLNAKLSDAIPDGTAIPLSYLEGQGVYNVKVRDSDMTRRFAYDPTLKTGYVLEFTRPWNQ